MNVYFDELIRYAKKHHVHDPEDVVQTVFLRFLQKNVQPGRALLFHAVRHAMIDRLRRSRCERREDIPEERLNELQEPPPPPPRAEIQLHTLIVKLDKPDRDFIVAVYEKGCAKAAEEYGHSYEAARWRSQKIVEKLRTLCE
jgi:RNA polymerase sigma factor (sigma-70 family)